MTFKEDMDELGVVVVQRPHFTCIEKDDVDFEWCFGKQGDNSSWRLSMMVPVEHPEKAWLLLTTFSYQYNWTLSEDILKDVGGHASNPWLPLRKLLEYSYDNKDTPPSLDFVEKLVS